MLYFVKTTINGIILMRLNNKKINNITKTKKGTMYEKQGSLCLLRKMHTEN